MGGQQASLPVAIIWLQALAVPVLGLVAAWIAYQQWRTADRKVQLDLFDRRFAVYEAARDVVREIVRHGAADGANARAFAMATDKARFLFGAEVISQIDLTRDGIAKLIQISGRLKADGPKPDGLLDAEFKALVDIESFFTVMPPLIEPYMDLSHKSGRSRRR
jgi:hypothetical protein